ncbi:MAG: hypothetical protein WC674_09440 [Candidatus Krumholzibacteriia bacterium]
MKGAGSILLFAGCVAACCVVLAFIGCGEDSVAPPKPDSPGLPSVIIDQPPPTALEPQYAKVTAFGWSAGEGAAPAAVRYLWSPVVDTTGTYNPAFDIIGDLNANPRRYESAWSRWMPFNAPGDSGRTTVLGDDEVLTAGRTYIFAVQARDAAGRTEDTFSTRTNARRFKVRASAMPLLILYDEYLVGFRFLGTNLNPERRDLPPGVPLRFTWRANVSDYGGTIAGYRYSWDVPDASAWDAPFEPGLTGASEVAFYAGVHTLFVETIDIAGNRTLARVTVNVVPFPMDRSLLFVDDYYSTNMPVNDYSNPTESVHDQFWLRTCSRAAGFDPARDVYDAVQNQLKLPALDLLGRYRNVIWTYSSENNAWSKMIPFTPESQVGKAGRHPVNYLSMFLLKGGHLWTLGQGQRGGGLAAALSQAAQSFPMNLACEITANREDCGGDRSSVHSMPYRDYCVTMLDKIDGIFRTGSGMPERIKNHYDCMSYGLRDDSDPLTAAHPGFPPRIDLWTEVTKSGRYFNPEDSLGPGGFTYVEVYDPGYWMERTAARSQPCFHPIYSMRAKSENSALNAAAVALWVTKYEHVVPEVSAGTGVAAASFHFGFPLWFFRRSAVDSIAAVVFDEWGILIPQ